MCCLAYSTPWSSLLRSSKRHLLTQIVCSVSKLQCIVQKSRTHACTRLHFWSECGTYTRTPICNCLLTHCGSRVKYRTLTYTYDLFRTVTTLSLLLIHKSNSILVYSIYQVSFSPELYSQNSTALKSCPIIGQNKKSIFSPIVKNIAKLTRTQRKWTA